MGRIPKERAKRMQQEQDRVRDYENNLVVAAKMLPSVFASRVRPKFILPKHLEPVDEALHMVMYADLRRLIITLPRRHGKSFLTSQTFPLWYIANMERMGRTVDVMFASYNQDKSDEISKSIRDLFEHDEFKRIFPDTRLKDDLRGERHWQTVKGSNFYSVSPGSAVTGRGCNLLILDDVIKNAEEALSATYRAKLYEWYSTAAVSSMYEDAAIIHISTRWHSEDLIGQVLAHDEKEEDEALKENWLVIHQQAILDEGTEKERPLWPYNPALKIGFTLRTLHKIRNTQGERWWSTQYRGIPIDIGAGCLGMPKNRKLVMPVKKLCYVDTAFDGKDSTAFVIGGLIIEKDRYGNTRKRISIIRAELIRKSSVELAPEIARICNSLGVQSIICEKNADKGWTSKELQKHGCHVIDKTTTKNKIGRIQYWIGSRYDDYYFSHDCSPAFIEELGRWSELAAHDDAPDAVAGLAEYLLDNSTRVKVLPTNLFRS